MPGARCTNVIAPDPLGAMTFVFRIAVRDCPGDVLPGQVHRGYGVIVTPVLPVTPPTVA